MCKSRCITHQGKVISATGVHNHLPHINSKNDIPQKHIPNDYLTISSKSMPSSSSSSIQQQHQQSMMQAPYNYLQQLEDIDRNSMMHRQSNIIQGTVEGKNIFNPLESSSHFKIEDI
jgi:hypothetical protein